VFIQWPGNIHDSALQRMCGSHLSMSEQRNQRGGAWPEWPNGKYTPEPIRGVEQKHYAFSALLFCHTVALNLSLPACMRRHCIIIISSLYAYCLQACSRGGLRHLYLKEYRSQTARKLTQMNRVLTNNQVWQPNSNLLLSKGMNVNWPVYLIISQAVI
jgi:hypothetical protein